MPGKKPTMKDVARLAGVTQPTVSYVINGTATISDEVKEKVYQAIRELHYTPNYNAVALKTQRTFAVGIILPDITNAYYANMVSLLERELTQAGYLALFGSTEYSEKKEEDILNRFLERNVDALIIAYEMGNPKCWKLLADSGKKVIAVEAAAAKKGFPGVEMDNFYGTYTATRHLIGEGRTKIVYIGQNTGIEALRIRERGYVEAIRRSGVQAKPLIFRTDGPGDKWQEGVAIGQMLAEETRFDGLVVSSDEIAVGIIRVLSSRGIRIPEEVSVIGYDNLPVAELYIPELSTVAQPLKEICSQTVLLLLRLLEGGDPASVLLRPELILRSTTL